MPQENPIRVVLVDDHVVVRAGLVYALSVMPNIDVVGQADDGDNALAVCTQFVPDVVLMDLVMPRVDGIEATRRIRSHFPKIQVIILTGFQEKDLVQRALEAGAIGYLLKHATSQELVKAINAAAKGQSTLTPEVVPFLIQTVTQPALHIGQDLTAREVEVLTHLVDGLTQAEIAERTIVSVNTVRFHVRSILAKLGVPNRTAAVRLALQEQLVAAEPTEDHFSGYQVWSDSHFGALSLIAKRSPV